MISGDMSRITGVLADLREQLCDHAVHGCNKLQLASRRDVALSAIMVLISAAHEVAKEAKVEPAFQGLCASQVPAKGVIVP